MTTADGETLVHRIMVRRRKRCQTETYRHTTPYCPLCGVGWKPRSTARSIPTATRPITLPR